MKIKKIAADELLLMPPAAKTLFEKRVLDSQKLFIVGNLFESVAKKLGGILHGR